MSYVDLALIHDPVTGAVAPASWGDQIRENLEFLIDPPACSVNHSTNQSVPNATVTALLADTEQFDNDSMHSTSSNTSRITIQTGGRYLIFATVRTGSNQTGHRQVQIRANGDQVNSAYNIGRHDAAGDASTVISGSRALVLSAGEYVECTLEHNAGIDVTTALEEFAAYFMTR